MIKHVAVNACLTPLCSVAGMAITTVEGIGSTRTSLHPVQVSSYRKSSALHSDLNNDAKIVFYTAPFRSVLPKLMGLSVDSVLLGLSCPCTLCSGTTPLLQRKKLRLLLRVSFRVSLYHPQNPTPSKEEIEAIVIINMIMNSPNSVNLKGLECDFIIHHVRYRGFC